MECTEDGELTVLTLGEEKVREGSYNIINDYAHEKSERPGDEGHWAYAHFPDFETFSRVIIGETTENRVPEMNYNLQLGLTTLYLESHDEIKRCLGSMMDTRPVPMEEQKKQDEELIKARESLRNRTAAIHTAWNIQGVLHMWRAHCQSPKYAGRFGRNLYKEILCAWKRTRDFLGEEDTVSIKWLDTWVSKFNDYYQQKEDWVQQTLSWNMIHDAGDAEFGHDSIRHWQVEINKFRYRHRSILDIDTTIAGIKERMSQFRLMIKDPNSYHGWAAGNCYWQIRTEEFRILANQLMDLEFRQRLQDHPSSNTKFLELDRLALIIFKNQTIESFKALGTSAVRADLMIETWFATFGLLLNYDMICTGYAWSVIRSTSLMDTDCFIISYQDLESKKAGWQCPVTMTKITSFLTGLKSFIKRRADSLRKRNRKAAAQLTESRIAHLDSATEGVEPELNQELELTEASSQGEVGQTSPEVSGSKGKSTAPTLSNQELTKDSTNLARTRRQDSHENTPSHPATKTITTMPGSSRDAAKSKTKPAPNKKQSTTPISTPPTEASNFDWFEEVIEPAVDSCSSIYGGSDPAAEVESIGHQKPAAGTPVSNLNNLDRNKGITYASVTKTGAREVSLTKPLVPSSPTPSLPRKEISQSKIPKDTAKKEDKFMGYIEPSSGPWIEVTKKKPGETPPETQNIKNPRKKLVFSVGKNKADTPKATSSLPKNEQAIDTRKIEKSARISPADRVEQAASRVTAKNTPAPTNRYHTDTNNYPHLPQKSVGPQTPTRTAAVIAIRGSASSSRQVSGENVKKVEWVQPKERAGQLKEPNRELHYPNPESVVPRTNKTMVPSAKQDSIPVRSQRDTLTGRELEATFNPEPRETKLNETDNPTIGSQEPESNHLLQQGPESAIEEMPGKPEIQGGMSSSPDQEEKSH